MTVQHTNFYETLKEAQMRLQNTIVLYDNEPYFVICIDNHNSDGIFRIYMEPLGHLDGLSYGNCPYGGSHPGPAMDEFLQANKNTRIVRKHLNSPLFAKFRPFPLGMCDTNGVTYYCERAPVRATYQGLNRDMVNSALVTLDAVSRKTRYGGSPEIWSKDFYNTIKGLYMSPQEALGHLTSGKVKNVSLSFHRLFCFIRGPVNTTFLSYKGEIVGVLPNNDLTQLNLIKKYFYTQEVITELGVFEKICIADS